ncbi:MAG: hypothetical protein JWL87_366 [Candidatus Adlerbacteria bacterium]|nr:hypothetical protein [Candidatus Adlerbacteria bacterium]
MSLRLVPAQPKVIANPFTSQEVDGEVVHYADIPYVADRRPWAEQVKEVASETKLHYELASLGRHFKVPGTHPGGLLRICLVRPSFVPGIYGAVTWGLGHGFQLASPYHLLAVARAIPNIKDCFPAKNKKDRKGPGLLATEPSNKTDDAKYFGLWYPVPEEPCSASSVPSSNAGLGKMTLYLFVSKPWEPA